jgi:hypothetical protein
MEKMEHIKLPLTCFPNEDYYNTYHIFPADMHVPDFTNNGALADYEAGTSEFIVKACNSYYDMLVTLEYLESILSEESEENFEMELGKIRYAIKKAEGE